MKKAIAIIGFVLAVLVFGSCELQKGGTIKVENINKEMSVIIYVTDKDPGIITEPPKTGVVAKKTIAAGKTGEISIGEDGTYFVRAFYDLPLAGESPGIVVEPITAMAILTLGNTVSFKVKFLTD